MKIEFECAKGGVHDMGDVLEYRKGQQPKEHIAKVRMTDIDVIHKIMEGRTATLDAGGIICHLRVCFEPVVEYQGTTIQYFYPGHRDDLAACAWKFEE